MAAVKILKTCPQGHQFYKSSDCPICEKERKPESGFKAKLSAPARRALENNGIENVQQLSQFSESEILKLHGMGPNSLPKLKQALAAEGLPLKFT
jgi:DNA-directed RNA polymerase alpha subunit